MYPWAGGALALDRHPIDFRSVVTELEVSSKVLMKSHADRATDIESEIGFRSAFKGLGCRIGADQSLVGHVSGTTAVFEIQLVIGSHCGQRGQRDAQRDGARSEDHERL